MRISDLEGRNIGLLGLGREGLAALGFLRRHLADLRLTIYAEARPDAEALATLDPAFDRLVVGPLDADALRAHDVLVRSPGISPYREVFDAFRACGGRFTSASSLWFAANPDARSLCITGTKGKSTTTMLVTQLLRAAGLDAQAAGNIGAPMLAHPGRNPDWWVIELSSYQLCDLEGRPTAGALLRLSDEHLDWHGGPDRYRRDKLQLARLLEGRPLVADASDPVVRDALRGQAGVKWFNRAGAWRVGEDGVENDPVGVAGLRLPAMPGRHNAANLAAALALVETVAELPWPLQPVLDDCRGLPHRLHLLGEVGGIRYVDDSLSTTPVATLAALEAYREEPVVVLVGGLDRGLDWSAVANRFQELAPHALVAMPDSGPHLLEQLRAAGLELVGGLHAAADLRDAVGKAREIVPRGGMILLSPGAPSFGQFSDYRARGRAFAACAGLA